MQHMREKLLFSLTKILIFLPEIAFWKSIGLVQTGRINEARELALIAFEENSGWEELLRRCANNGLAGVTDDTISALLHSNQDD